LVDIFAERKEQVRSTASVQPKCRFLGSSMRLEPVAEGGNENGTGGRALGWLALADLVPDEVLMEKLHPERRVIANPSSLEMRASAAAKMSTKGIKHVEIELRQYTAFSLNEAAEMGGGSNVANGAGRCVSVAFEVVCERVDMWSTNSSAQAPQRLGRGEVLF
jgi:hypothetical protein